MRFQNEKHRETFESITERKDKEDHALMAALYLLTADYKLWQIMAQHINRNRICFRDIKLNGIHVTGYTLFCAAKDLYLGTKHLTIHDLADKNLISPRYFEIVCNAMAIRRNGLDAIYTEGREWA